MAGERTIVRSCAYSVEYLGRGIGLTEDAFQDFAWGLRHSEDCILDHASCTILTSAQGLAAFDGSQRVSKTEAELRRRVQAAEKIHKSMYRRQAVDRVLFSN